MLFDYEIKRDLKTREVGRKQMKKTEVWSCRLGESKNYYAIMSKSLASVVLLI